MIDLLLVVYSSDGAVLMYWIIEVQLCSHPDWDEITWFGNSRLPGPDGTKKDSTSDAHDDSSGNLRVRGPLDFGLLPLVPVGLVAEVNARDRLPCLLFVLCNF